MNSSSPSGHFKSVGASSFPAYLVILVICSGVVCRASPAPGNVDLTFDAGSALNAAPYAIALQSNGKIVIGGDFTTIAGLVRNRIARLNADGTGDPSFNPGTGANGHVRSVVLQPDGKLLVGGWFTEVNGVGRNRIARLNADGSLDTSFNPGTGANASVFAVALQPDGKVLIGGYFTEVNGTSANYIARLNEDGSVDDTFQPGGGPNYYVYSIVLQSDAKIIVGGWFTTFDGTDIRGVARLFPDGSLDTSFDPGRGVGNYSASALALQPDGRLIVGDRSLVRLNTDGSVDSTFKSSPSDFVTSIALQSDGKVLIGGQFYTVNGKIHSYLARLHADGSLDDSFSPPLQLYPPGVATLAVEPEGTILVSAGFFAVNGLGPKNLVRLNADGSVNNSLHPNTGINGYGVFSGCVQSDGKILVAGNFGDVNNLRRQGIARLESDGRLDESFDPGLMLNRAYYSVSNPVVYSVALQLDGRIVIGGGFTNINGYSRNCIARLNTDGSVDPSFNPGSGADYNVYRVVLQPDGKILIMGGFTEVDGISRDEFARLNSNGSLDASFNPNIGFVNDATVKPDGRIVVVGYVITNSAVRYFITQLNPDGDVDQNFDAGEPDKGVFSVALQSDGKLLVSGDFTEINGISRRGMARLKSDGSLDLSFNPMIPTGGTGDLLRGTLLQPDGKIIVSGVSTDKEGRLNGVIARMNLDGTADDSFAQCTVLGFAVPIALQPDSKVVIGGSFWTANGVPRFAVARLLGDAPAITTQPESRTNIIGTTAAFTVIVSGAEPLSYQWFKDGIALGDLGTISGVKKATLVLEHVRPIDAGSYTVVITNLAGSVVSEPALLQVQKRANVPVRVTPRSPASTNEFEAKERKIFNGFATTQRHTRDANHGSVYMLLRQNDGHALLKASVTPGMEYAIQASTNLLDWQVIGVFRNDGTGSIDFEDTEATQFPARFYRIVTPFP